MKLYTEEQVLEIISKYNKAYFKTSKQKLDEMNITPIELPSDEEIEKEFAVIFAGEEYKCYDMVEGAIWMRDKIQGGNK
jgi:elongation factor P hydroxylase